MKSIKILSGGFLNKIPIINDELVKQNNKILEDNNDFYDLNTFNLTLPKINTIKQLTILKAIVDEYKNELAYDEKLVLSYVKDLNSIKIDQSKELLFGKYSELKKINIIISRYCSDIEGLNQIKIKNGTLDKDENKKLEKALSEYTKKLPQKIALESEINATNKLTSEEITILEAEISCKKETNEKKQSMEKSIEDKKKILDKINNFIEENLDIDKLKEKLASYQEKDKSIKLLLDQNDKYKLFSDIIDYLTNHPIYEESDSKKATNIAVYPGVDNIKCDGLDLKGKRIGWFISQKNKILKEYGKESNDTKLSEYCSKIELINDLKNINITEGDYNNKYNKFNYDLLVKDNYKNYENIFDILVAYSSWSDNNFAGLYQKNDDGSLKNFIIYEHTTFTSSSGDINVYHELFKSTENILPSDNIYEFDRSSHQFKLTTRPRGLQDKSLVYPVFSVKKPSRLCDSLIDGIFLYSNFKEIEKLLRYYKLIFEIKVFDKWINKYGVFTGFQFIPHNSPNILTTFILSNNFDIYFNILLELNYVTGFLISSKDRVISIIEEGDDIATHELYLAITKNIKIEDYEEYSKFINEEINKKIKEFGTFSIDDINIQDSLCDKIFELFKIIIVKNKKIEVEGLFIIINKLKEIKSINILIYDLINSFIFGFYQINSVRQILTNTYNFSKLNYLFSLFKKDFNDQTRINSRMTDFNSFINLTENQVFSLFFIELIEESIFFFKSWWRPRHSMDTLHRESDDDKSITILNKTCLLNILCSFYFLQIYDNNKVSSLINYKLQFIKLNVVMGNIENNIEVYDSYISPRPKPFTITNVERFNVLYKYIFSKLDGFKAYGYREENLYYYFDDPRKDKDAIKLTKAGRPMCGEVTILNFLNFLLFNKTTKKIDFNYLPKITQKDNTALTDFYKKYNDLSEYNKNKQLISEFFSFMINIPFEIINGIDDVISIGAFNRDYGDFNIPCIYRYNTVVNKGGKTFIDNGVELRVTYYNLLRVLSFILKLDGELELRKLEENRLDDVFIKNALKEIIKLFQNPHILNILKDYKIIYDREDHIYSYSHPIDIEIHGATLKLSAHSEFNLISNAHKNFRKIKKLFPKSTYYIMLNRITYTKEDPVDIYTSIFFALFKENNIYSEINFKYIPEEYIIKFLNILHVDFDDLYIPSSIILDLLILKRSKILQIIFDKFNFPKQFYHLYLNYLIVNGCDFDIKKYLKKYFLKYNILTPQLFTNVIDYNNIEIVKDIIDNKQNNLKYDLWAIKTQEMFNLLDSTINSKTNKIDLYTEKIVNSIINNKSIKLEFLDSEIFKRILTVNIDFFKEYIFRCNNISKNLIEKISKLKSIKKIITPKILFTNIASYKIFELIKIKLPFYDFKNEDNLRMIISNNYKRLIGTGIYTSGFLPHEKIEDQIDILNLLCSMAENNKNLFLEQILCEIIAFRKNNLTDNSPVITSKTHLLSAYISHKFYEKFSEIFNSLNVYSNEYVYLCQPIFKLLTYKIKNDILDVNFKKLKDKSEIEITKKIIEEYPKLYEKNMESYLSNMYKIYGSSYLPEIRTIIKGTVHQTSHHFIINSYIKRKIPLDILLIAYYGTDELTDFLITHFTVARLSSEISLLYKILKRYNDIGDDLSLNISIRDISKKNSKYTKEYICKNMIKLLNVIITRIDVTIDPTIIPQLHTIIVKICDNINMENKFLIKCLKNIINADKLYNSDNIHIIKRHIDRQIKTILEIEGINIKSMPFNSIVKLFKNEDLNTIVKKLGMK